MVEIIVGLGLIGIVALLIAIIYFAHFRLFANQVTGIDVLSQNKLALDEITNQIRQSQAVATTCCSPTETTSATVLVLQLWPIDASGEPFDPGASNYDYVIYKQDSSDPNNIKLARKIKSAPTSSRTASTKIISGYLTSDGLQFTYDPDIPTSAKVTVTVKTTGQYGDRVQTQIQSATAVLRNK